MKSETLSNSGPWYHGTRNEFDIIEPGEGGAYHLGTLEQAKTRATLKGRILSYKVFSKSFVRYKDKGSWSKQTIKNVLKKGYDGIIYLNRYEGIPVHRFDELSSKGLDADKLSDDDFKKHVPEAHDSIIVFDLPCLKLLTATA